MTVKSIGRQIAGGVGYLWGFILVIAVMLVFVGLDFWSLQFSKLPFMKIHPRYAGGEIVQTIEDSGFRYEIHEPIFDGLIGPRTEGFVQLKVAYAEQVPSGFEKSIDYDRDGTADFSIRISDGEHSVPEVIVLADNVVGMGQWARVKDGWIVRTVIRRK